MMKGLGRHGRWLLGTLAAGTVLAAVFWLYLQPGMVIDLATRVWSCL
ncbi:MAG: hypothetical protein QM742_03385 [Aquabacterium sp.]